MRPFEPVYHTLTCDPYLPITSYCFAVQDDAPNPAPVLCIDAAGRPDAADAIRRIQAELDGPEGFVARSWHVALTREGVMLVLNARIVRPVTCSLRMVFGFRKHFDILSAMATSGYLGLAVEPIATDLNDMAHTPISWFPTGPELPQICAAATAYARLVARPDDTSNRETETHAGGDPILTDRSIPEVFVKAFET